MPLRVIPGHLAFLPTLIAFKLDAGTKIVSCTISHVVLCDLGDLQSVIGTPISLFSRLLPEIEYIATAKFRSGRITDNEAFSIETADLLLYARRRVRQRIPLRRPIG